MEFLTPEGFGVPEDPERVYWRAYRETVDAKYNEFKGAASVFGYSYIKPIECDEVGRKAEELETYYNEGLKQASFDQFSMPVPTSKPYSLLAFLTSGISKIDELKSDVRRFRSVCYKQDSESKRLLGNIKTKIGNIESTHRSILREVGILAGDSEVGQDFL